MRIITMLPDFVLKIPFFILHNANEYFTLKMSNVSNYNERLIKYYNLNI